MSTSIVRAAVIFSASTVPRWSLRPYRRVQLHRDFEQLRRAIPVGLIDPDKFNPSLAEHFLHPTQYSHWLRPELVAFDSTRDSWSRRFVDIGYVGNKSTNLVVFADYNQALPNGPGENLSIQARRPNQTFGAITVTWPGAFANYHALQAKLERRFTSGFYLLNSFVYSKAIDNTGQALEAQGSGGRASPQKLL